MPTDPFFDETLNWKPGWRPSNGTEGRLFMANWCDFCIHDRKARTEPFEGGCELILRSLQGERIEEWLDAQTPQGWFVQRCTAFEDDKTVDRTRPPFHTPVSIHPIVKPPHAPHTDKED